MIGSFFCVADVNAVRLVMACATQRHRAHVFQLRSITRGQRILKAPDRARLQRPVDDWHNCRALIWKCQVTLTRAPWPFVQSRHRHHGRCEPPAWLLSPNAFWCFDAHSIMLWNIWQPIHILDGTYTSRLKADSLRLCYSRVAIFTTCWLTNVLLKESFGD